MDRDVFERSLRAFVRQVPFHPFRVELVSGSQLRIDHPEALVFRAGTAIHFDKDGIPTLFGYQGVARMTGSVDVSQSA